MCPLRPEADSGWTPPTDCMPHVRQKGEWRGLQGFLALTTGSM